MAQLGGHAIYLTNDSVLGARESVRDVARNLERFVDAIVVRTGPHEVAVELAAQADDPGHQRPDPPRASLPGAGRRVHDPGAVRAARRARRRLRRRRQQRLPLARAARAPRSGMEVRLAHPPGYAPERADRRRGPRELAERVAAAGCVFGHDPVEAVRGADGRLHRRLDLDGPGGRDRGAARRLRRLPGRRRAARRGRARTPGDALPAGPPRRGDHVRRSWTARAA